MPCARRMRARSAKVVIIGHDHAAFACGDDFARMKAEAGRVAQRAYSFAFVDSAQRGSGIFNDGLIHAD